MEGVRGNQRGVVLCAGKLGCVNDGTSAQPEARCRRRYKACLLNEGSGAISFNKIKVRIEAIRP